MRDLGGGRKESKEEKIDYSVGMRIKAKVGKTLNTGDLIGYVYSDDSAKARIAVQTLQDSVSYSSDYIAVPEITRGTYPVAI